MMWVFLVVIGLIWLIFAAIHDLKTREVANWVSFSLIAIGLGGRLFYSIEQETMHVFYYGIVSGLIMTAIAFILYFGKVFAGGDLKLMIGLGTFVPGTTLQSVLTNCLISVVFLLIAGAIYSFLMSFFIAVKRKREFVTAFRKQIKLYFYIIPVLALAWIFLNTGNWQGNLILGLISFSLISYPYFKAIEKCMIKLYNPRELTEGDWLVDDVRVGNKTIKATVHGLSMKEIDLLVKSRRKVLIKEGIPFVPAFLLAFIIMVFFFVLKGQDYFVQMFLSLF